MTPAAISDEIRAARADFHKLVHESTAAELRRRSNGTRWTNEQLLFHMVFGYIIVRALLWVVRGFSMLPDSFSRRFAAALGVTTRAFHVINYLGSVGGARILGHSRMEEVMDNVTDSLIRSLERADERRLAGGMHFPRGWDPYFRDYMTVQDVLHYATQHYQHHRLQLTLSSAHNA